MDKRNHYHESIKDPDTFLKCLEINCQSKYPFLLNKKLEPIEDNLNTARKDLQHHLWSHHNIEVIKSHSLANNAVQKIREFYAEKRRRNFGLSIQNGSTDKNSY